MKSDAATHEEFSDLIVAHLLKVQRREVARDTGHGIKSARQIGQAVGMDTKECRDLLRAMAQAGQVRFHDCMNGHFWSSVNPLPWEPGGDMHREQERLAEAWKKPLTLIVQSVWSGRHGPMSRDEKAYPAELRDLAIAHVERENYASKQRRRTDYHDGRHLGSSYTPPPTYRLVSLVDNTNPEAEHG